MSQKHVEEYYDFSLYCPWSDKTTHGQNFAITLIDTALLNIYQIGPSVTPTWRDFLSYESVILLSWS